jgi:hypothetical protein
MGRGRALQSATVRLFAQIGKGVFVLAYPPDALRAQTVAGEGRTGAGRCHPWSPRLGYSTVG